MKQLNLDFAVVVPLANEASTFTKLAERLAEQLTALNSGRVYLVVDNASLDNTKELCERLSVKDKRFVTVYEPANKNVVDAYLRGYREAFEQGHEFIMEMDGGLSHDPASLPEFIKAYQQGYDCVFGSRFIKGGDMVDSNFKRRFLSKGGTVLSNALLGTRLKDMTSGYQGFSRKIVGEILNYGLKSKAHFYQTEVRYLLRNKKAIEIPIRYRAASPSISSGALLDSLKNLAYYFFNRVTFKQRSFPA